MASQRGKWRRWAGFIDLGAPPLSADEALPPSCACMEMRGWEELREDEGVGRICRKRQGAAAMGDRLIGEEEETGIGCFVLDLGFHPVCQKGSYANEQDGSLCLSVPLTSGPICHRPNQRSCR
jgi:hypothetical protein